MHNALTDIPGIQVGHAQDLDAMTGCTVILCPDGAVAGVDQRGGAPGTRETDPLHPMHLVERVHAILLSGGSAFGLDAAGGVVRYLEERGVGFEVGAVRVPIVPAAILFDLGLGDAKIRPDAAMGYQACLNASADRPAQGNVGAGTGATVGKILGMEQAMKSGIGSASVELRAGVRVAALAAVNAIGDVIDPANGQIIAGVRSPAPPPGESAAAVPFFADTLKIMVGRMADQTPASGRGEHTVIGVVASNVLLNKEQTNKMAQMAHDGLARTIRPAHTMFDGDTIFALAIGDTPADINVIGSYAAEVFAQAVLQAVHAAEAVPGLPAARGQP